MISAARVCSRWAFGPQFLLEVFAEEMVEAVVFRADEIGGGIDAESYGVAGGAGFAFFGAWPGGGFGIAAVRGDLSFCCHGCSFSRVQVYPR